MTASHPKASQATDCPNCGGVPFSPGEQRTSLRASLLDWQVQGGLEFSQAVWDEYADKLDTEMRLHRCPRCTFRQFVPPLAGTAAFYAAISKGEGSYYTAQRWEFRKAIAAIGRSGAETLLDAGCGAGAFLKQLKKSGNYRAFGHDFNPNAKDVLAAEGLECAVSLEDEIIPGGFDVVTCFQVLEHLTDPWQYGAGLRRHLRPGGLLILTTPDHDGPIRNFTTSVTDLPPHHVSRWNAQSMRTFGERFGFKVRRIRREPLPSYVWRYYLPVMIRNSRLPSQLKWRLLAHSRVERMLGLLERLGVTELPPLPGHTLYAEFEG